MERPVRPRQDHYVDVSICIPNWNCREYLRACLESLREMPQGLRLQVVVVDNASTDGAARMVREEFPEVELIENPTNFGFSRACNQGADQARGKYLLFLNNDTVVPPGAIRTLFDYAENHPAVGIIGPRLVDPAGHMQISYRNKPTIMALLHRTTLFRWTGLLRSAYYGYRRDSFDSRSTREVEVLMGAALMVRRDRFERHGRWDEQFRFGGEDIELSIRMGKQHPLIYLAEVDILHHGRVSSRKNISFATSNVAIGYVYLFRKSGFSRLAILAYKLAVTLDAPVSFFGKVVQSAYRAIRGQKRRAAKSWLVVRGAWNFMTRDLLRFWRA